MGRRNSELVCLVSVLACLVWVGCAATPPGNGNEDQNGDGTANGDAPPAIAILEPTEDFSITVGDTFTIQWDDSDIDSNAEISFLLFADRGNGLPTAVGTVNEDDIGAIADPDFLTVDTTGLAPGEYQIYVTITDNVNPSISQFIMNQAGSQLIVTVEVFDE